MTLTPLNGTTPERVIQQSMAESVQNLPSVTKDGVMTSGFSWGYQRGTYLPPWGTRQREFVLREIYRMDEQILIRGAFQGVAKTIAALPWEIKGDEDTDDPAYGEMAQARGWRLRRSNGVEYYQEVFRQANFGRGWGSLITQVVNDFLRYDAGCYIEAIFQGDSYDAPRGPITGLAHLDPLHCYPTGDPQYPAIYYDRYGGLHVMHHSRMIRMLDMEDGDDLHPGYGDSALSRSISVAMRQVFTTRYINGRLDDKPPPGFSIIHGILKPEWDKAVNGYATQQANDSKPPFGQHMFYFTMDTANPPKIDTQEFSSAPEKFDFRTYTDIDVDELALALGVDRQELMQLTSGGTMGSGAQSVILHQKSRGKTIGFLMQQIERRFNDLLPDEFTFEFKYRDAQEALEEAQKAQVIATAVAAMGTALSPDEQRTYLASNIEGVQDAISNTPRGNDVFNTPMVAEDNTPGSAPIAPAQQATVNINDNVDDEIKSVVKNYYTTEVAFVQDVTDLLLSAAQETPYLDRRAFGVVMRSLLKTYGTQAYKDGMASGGVYVDTLDADDAAASAMVFVDQSQYISGLADDVFKTKTVTANTAYARAQMWGKSLQAFNDAGLMAANQNAMYEWRVGMTEHCPDCLRLNGQVHRIRNWKASGWMPKGNKIACKGYRCQCQLVRTTEKARGRF